MSECSSPNSNTGSPSNRAESQYITESNIQSVFDLLECGDKSNTDIYVEGDKSIEGGTSVEAKHDNSQLTTILDQHSAIQEYNDAKEKQLTTIRALSEHHVPYYPTGPTETANKTVLVEEDYHTLMRTLIERDYFPDIERLRLQLQIYSAIDSNDTETADELTSKFMENLKKSLKKERTRGLNISNVVNKGNTKAWNALQDVKRIRNALEEAYNPTAQINDDNTPMVRGVTHDPDEEEKATHVLSVEKGRDVLLNMNNLTLESFHRRFTSEDNASFVQLTQEQNKKKDEKILWMTQDVDQHNMKNLKLRLRIENDLSLIAPPPKRIAQSEGQQVRELVFDDLINSVDDEKRHQYKVAIKEAEPDPESILSVQAATVNKVVVQKDPLNNMKERNKNENIGFIYNTAVPKSSVFFAPDTRKIKITEPKIISTASTRLALSAQLDDVLEMGKSDTDINAKKTQKHISELKEAAAMNVDEWLKGSNLDERSKNLKGLELLQMGVDPLANNETEGYKFIEEDRRELLGYEIANKVLEKKRNERYNDSHMGRHERGQRLKDALNTPMSSLPSIVRGSTTTNTMTTGMGTNTMTTNTMGTNTMGTNSMGSSRGVDSIYRNLTPLLRTNSMMRRHIRTKTEGILSSKKSSYRQDTANDIM